MLITDIISIPAEDPGSSYLRIIIEGKMYSEGFANLTELQKYFRLKRTRAITRTSLPSVIHKTETIEIFRIDKTHSVISVLNDKGESLYHLVGGPAAHIWDRMFLGEDSLKDAMDFARLQAAQYDQA